MPDGQITTRQREHDRNRQGGTKAPAMAKRVKFSQVIQRPG